MFMFHYPYFYNPYVLISLSFIFLIYYSIFFPLFYIIFEIIIYILKLIIISFKLFYYIYIFI